MAVRGGLLGVGTAAGLVFFAFAGYARIATLGEEVRNPERTLPRAILIALGAALVTYLLVAVALLVGLGAERLAVESAPLVALVDTGRASAVGVLVRVGAAVAAGSALLTVLIGLSRMELAMARRGELPPALAVVGPRGTPWRADLVGGLVGDRDRGAGRSGRRDRGVGLLGAGVLRRDQPRRAAAAAGQRHWPGWTAGLGCVLCLVLALLLPFAQVLITAGVLAIIWTACTVLPQPVLVCSSVPAVDELLTSPLHDRHVALGATLGAFGGWQMPISYPGGTVAEHTAVRAALGLFDVSHLGKLAITGPGAAAFVNRCFTADLDKIGPGAGAVHAVLHGRGRGGRRRDRLPGRPGRGAGRAERGQRGAGGPAAAGGRAGRRRDHRPAPRAGRARGAGPAGPGGGRRGAGHAAGAGLHGVHRRRRDPGLPHRLHR